MSYTFATIDDLELPSDDLAALRNALHDERRFRREQLAALAASRSPDGAQPNNDRGTARAEVLTALADAAELVLVDVEAALHRIGTGRYGACQLCDRPIPLPRLRVLPQARYCGPCHQLKESIS
ncbi:TraR/DksA C4-type zinc finger protein [Kribbella sp. NPDC005582]|uniref:TraR/DksA family transcriptional regulator n=1 Tax=Kribbella sp. NPDC005582 TaxID=3156893 RepID=UPI0033B16F73